MTEALRQLVRVYPWLLPAAELARLAVFGAFVALVVRVAWCARGGWGSRQARGAVAGLVGYVLVISCATGFLQQEAWPFTHWALVRNVATARTASWELEGLDASGRTWVIDARVLQPLSPEEFGVWMARRLARLDAAKREALGRFILERAERGRQRLVAGRAVGSNGWLLGPLAAPYHLHARGEWRSAADVPTSPFVGVRVWALAWDVEERSRDERRVDRTLWLEHRG